MNFTLTRNEAHLYGVFGTMVSDDGLHTFATLEHAYKDGSGFSPKVAAGIYTCERHSPNRLKYETFTLLNVPPFQNAPVSGILIHKGNYNGDSIGCILIGKSKGSCMIEDSRTAFEEFMELQKDLDTFTLTII